jgi:hypothetical protein
MMSLLDEPTTAAVLLAKAPLGVRIVHASSSRFILGLGRDAILRLKWVPDTTGGWLKLASVVFYRRATGAADTVYAPAPLASSPALAWAAAKPIKRPNVPLKYQRRRLA